MKLAWLLWLASWLPAGTQEQLCLATTVYLEARDQSVQGQLAVAEVVLRRRDRGRWGRDVCSVVKATRQFAPGLVSKDFIVRPGRAWDRAWTLAGDALEAWRHPQRDRRLLVPGADHFFAHDIVVPPPDWAVGEPVAVIGDHSFYAVGL